VLPVEGEPIAQPLTMDMILPAFSASFAGSQNVEVGQTVTHPSFTASYSAPIASATLSDNDGTPPLDVTSTPNAFASHGVFSRTTRGQSVTFLLHVVSASGVVRDLAAAIAWLSRARWGVRPPPDPAGDLASIVLALGSTALRGSRVGSISAAPGPSDVILHAFPASFGAPSYTLAGGFTGGWSQVSAAFDVTNLHGVTESFQLWRTNVAGLGGGSPVVFNVG
jgi:hypothetical protein